MINKKEILNFQQEWGDGIIRISKKYKSNGNYELEAKEFIKTLYSYETEPVFFKPTLASDNQFRLDKISALSYFIGDNPDYLEDEGFAIKEWNSVRWENVGIKIFENYAICMGNYFFGMENSSELKVEYTIIIKKINGVLKLILHDSHLPFQK
tara:strand:+ start:5242 stop:5700 length:459 start_codon:yes stop_codon:yes gene_type:complete